ncbi:MAG: TetR/AcrR family transcriptional regulator [Ilumatobacteraceae bacterium]
MTEDSQERQRLLDLVAGYCLEHGVADLRLRRVAEAIGSNNRMLLYYFGSKEQLIAAALLAAAQRFPGIRSAFDLLEADGETLERRLVAAWRSLSAERNLPFIGLFFEVVGLAIHQPGRFDGFFEAISHQWVDRVAAVLRGEGMSRAVAQRTAREIVALWRGLQLDLVSGHSRRSLDAVNAAAAARIGAMLPAE